MKKYETVVNNLKNESNETRLEAFFYFKQDFNYK